MNIIQIFFSINWGSLPGRILVVRTKGQIHLKNNQSPSHRSNCQDSGAGCLTILSGQNDSNIRERGHEHRQQGLRVVHRGHHRDDEEPRWHPGMEPDDKTTRFAVNIISVGSSQEHVRAESKKSGNSSWQEVRHWGPEERGDASPSEHCQRQEDCLHHLRVGGLDGLLQHDHGGKNYSGHSNVRLRCQIWKRSKKSKNINWE